MLWTPYIGLLSSAAHLGLSLVVHRHRELDARLRLHPDQRRVVALVIEEVLLPIVVEHTGRKGLS